MLTLEKFEEASEVVKQVTTPTKLVYSEYLSAQTGARIYLKPENMQHTGAYKIRGAYYKISTLSDEEKAKGLITASAGNHAQGVAYAARKFGNAVDTRDREFIRKEYLEMQKQNFYIPFKTKLLYIKSTNRILKSIVDKVKGR